MNKSSVRKYRFPFENRLIVTCEITDQCNMKCRMCDHGKTSRVHGRKPGMIDLEMFREVLSSLKTFRAKLFTPYWLGEPLLHPKFELLVREMKTQNQNNQAFRYLNINTNAELLDDDLAGALISLSAEPNFAPDTFVRLHFSLDATREDTYRLIKQRPQLKLEIVEQRIVSYLKRLRGAGFIFPKLNFTIIAMTENITELKEFFQKWEGICRQIGIPIKRCHDWPEGTNNGIYLRRLDTSTDQLAAENLHRAAAINLGLIAPPAEDSISKQPIIQRGSVLKAPGEDHNVNRPPCAGPFFTPVIHSSGAVTVCCFDTQLKLTAGNLKQQSLRQIWTSDYIHELRLAHIRGDLRAFPLCRNCTNLNTPIITPAEVEHYQAVNSY